MMSAIFSTRGFKSQARRPLGLNPGSGFGTAMRSAQDLVRAAVPMVHRLDRDSFMKAGRWLKRAVELDPNNVSAHAWFIQWCLRYVGQGWAADATAVLQRVRHLAERTTQLDPEDARGLTLAGHVLAFLEHRPEEALRLHKRALAVNYNLPLVWCLSGLAQSYIGNCAEGIRRIRHAQALSPSDPLDYFNETSLQLEPGFSVKQAIKRSPFATAKGRALFAEGLLAAGLR